jgi:hypothetical protein
MLDMGGGAQFCPQPLERNGREQGGEARRQLALGGGLDVSQHIGRTPAGEEPGDDLWRHRKADTRQLLSGHVGHDRFAVDQDAVAVEDVHGRPPKRPPLCGERCPRA